MSGNLASALPRKRATGCAMAAYDQLPPTLRRWLAQAALPWSPQSALRIWQRSRADEAAALARLTRAEAATLQRDRISRATTR